MGLQNANQEITLAIILLTFAVLLCTVSSYDEFSNETVVLFVY